jgi:hypothetical protein
MVVAHARRMRCLAMAMLLGVACNSVDAIDRPPDSPPDRGQPALDLAQPVLDLTAPVGLGGPCGATTCGPTQICVHPTCCTACVNWVDADLGTCPPGAVPHGYCSNIQGPCSIPCTAAPEFCGEAPNGCSAADPYKYCSGNGQEGGYCQRDGLHCIECY